MVMQLLSNEAVQDYVAGTKFREGKLPIETAMCDNFRGWAAGATFLPTLWIITNVCQPHGTGKLHYSL